MSTHTTKELGSLLYECLLSSRFYEREDTYQYLYVLLFRILHPKYGAIGFRNMESYIHEITTDYIIRIRKNKSLPERSCFLGYLRVMGVRQMKFKISKTYDQHGNNLKDYFSFDEKLHIIYDDNIEGDFVERNGCSINESFPNPEEVVHNQQRLVRFLRKLNTMCDSYGLSYGLRVLILHELLIKDSRSKRYPLINSLRDNRQRIICKTIIVHLEELQLIKN